MFKVTIVTPDELFFEGETSSLVAPGENGYFGVLTHHAPFVSTLGKGRLTLKQDSGTKSFQIEGGFFEVSKDRAIVLTDKIISAQGT